MAEKSNVMPNNLEAEQSLLGCMLIDNDILTELIGQLDERDFYQESHKNILEGMRSVFNDRRPIDIVTLCDKLEKLGTLESAGGIVYITELTQITPTSANYKYYFDIVRRDSINRGLIRAAREIITSAQKGGDSAENLRQAEEVIYNVSRVKEGAELKDIREGSGLRAVMDKFEKLAVDKDAFRGITTGINELDRKTNGLQKTDLIVIAARPGEGKTSLAMNIVEHAALSCDAVCAVFSLEMSNVQLLQRLLCGTANVSMSKALSAQLEANDWKKLIKAHDALLKSKIIIDEAGLNSPAQIMSKCRRIKAKNNGKLDLVMIDYIQLMKSDNKNVAGNRVQEVTDITRDLKIMAKELNVPVVALSQLRRPPQASVNSEPQLSDLRESGSIEQDADIVLFIKRLDKNLTPEEMDKKNIKKGDSELIIAKHRNGEQCRIKMKFKGEITKFVNPAPENGYTEPPEGEPIRFRHTPPIRDEEIPPEFASNEQDSYPDENYDDENPPY